MAQLETFLEFEAALGGMVARVWAKKAEPVLPDLIDAANAGDLYETDKILDNLLITSEIEDKLPKLRLVMQAAMLFGAELISGDVKKSALMNEGPTLLLDSAVEAFRGMVTTGLHELVARQAGKAIGAILADPVGDAEIVRKAELSMEEAVRQMVLGNGRMMADIASNLTTSRLVNYGALHEMKALGMKRYQLNATLDQRTSKVCRRMHGKIFEVTAALTFTENALRVTDPKELRSAAPWIKGDKKTLHMLETATSKELQSKGFMCPPFHPRCRTVVSPLGDVIVTGLEYTPVVLPVDPDLALLAATNGNAPTQLITTPVIDALKPDEETVRTINDIEGLTPKK